VDIIKFAVGVCVCVFVCVELVHIMWVSLGYRIVIVHIRITASCVLVGSAILYPSKEVRFEVNYFWCT
jgi:hypothetical protein